MGIGWHQTVSIFWNKFYNEAFMSTFSAFDQNDINNILPHAKTDILIKTPVSLCDVLNNMTKFL